MQRVIAHKGAKAAAASKGAKAAAWVSGAMVAGAAASSDASEHSECYSRPVNLSPTQLAQAVDVKQGREVGEADAVLEHSVESADRVSQSLIPAGKMAQAAELITTELVTSVNADGQMWHDVIELVVFATSLGSDPKMQEEIINHARGRSVTSTTMGQPSMCGGLGPPHASSQSASVDSADPMDKTDFVDVKGSGSVQSLSSFADSSSYSPSDVLLVENDDLRSEVALLRAENRELRRRLPTSKASSEVTSEAASDELVDAAAGKSQRPGPVTSSIAVHENGSCRVTLHPSRCVPSACAAEEPSWLVGAREALMASHPRSADPCPAGADAESRPSIAELSQLRPSALRALMATEPLPCASYGEKAAAAPPEVGRWSPALVMGAVVVIGGLALALSHSPKTAALATRQAAAAMKVLLAAFRIKVS